MPLSYQYFIVDADGKEQTRVSGPVQSVTTLLPRGNPSDNSRVTVGVYVSDVFGAFTRTVTTVEVLPPSGGQKVELKALSSVLNGQLSTILAAGHLQNAQSIVGSVSVAMNLGPQVRFVLKHIQKMCKTMLWVPFFSSSSEVRVVKGHWLMVKEKGIALFVERTIITQTSAH
jgi:hypothetical protein